jgi:hypothetical protein
MCVNIHQYYTPKSIFVNIRQFYLSNLQMMVTVVIIIISLSLPVSHSVTVSRRQPGPTEIK